MRQFAVAALLGYTMAISQIESQFLGYLTQFGKSYSTVEEYDMRLRNFAVHHQFIEEHNQEGHVYKVAHNKFSDWTDEEYKALLTYQPDNRKSNEPVQKSTVTSTPTDWRSSTCLQPIQDQGQCGSCWSFSATASLETAWCVQHDELNKLSEQQNVDCVKLCFGCNGGNASTAWYYMQSHNAISEDDYPYTALTQTCQYDSLPHTEVQTVETHTVTANDPTAMKEALETTIMSVAIEADQLCFQFYSTGIFTNTNCSTSLDHATNVVGWGTDSSTGMEYWIMRNSWGSTWGESGYMYIEIVDGDGLCGIQMEPNYPIVV